MEKTMCRYLVITVLAILFILGIDGDGHAMSLQVAPYRFVFRIDETNTQVAMVTNTSDRSIRIKIYPEAVPGQNPAEYLGDWVVVYPRLLSLEPGERKIVRFSVRAPKNLQNGEYRTLLFFEELPAEAKEKNGQNGEQQMDLQFLTKLGINLYGQYGKITRTGELRDVSMKLAENRLSIQGKFLNSGNAHLLMTARIIIMDNKQQIVKEKFVPAFAVHRNMEEIFTDELEFVGSGSYTLKILFKMEDVMIYEYTKTFEVKNTIS